MNIFSIFKKDREDGVNENLRKQEHGNITPLNNDKGTEVSNSISNKNKQNIGTNSSQTVYAGKIKSVDWDKRQGKIEYDDKTIYFKYRDSSIGDANIKKGLKVYFKISRGTREAFDIDKDPVSYGFLKHYDDAKFSGKLTIGTKEINFKYSQLRNDDIPIFNKIYFFDVIEDQARTVKYPKIIPDDSSGDLKVGQIKKGKIKSYKSFGYFVDIGCSRDALVHISEVSWEYSEGATLKIGDNVEVLVTKIAKTSGNFKVDASIKALIESPKIEEAVNIFQLDKMPLEIKLKYITDIAERENVLPQVKINTIRMIMSDQDIYKELKDIILPKLYDYCLKQFNKKIATNQYEEAYELLLEYCNYDFNAISMIDRFPNLFIENINATKIEITQEKNISDNELDAMLFSRKNNIDYSLSKGYQEKLENLLLNPADTNIDDIRCRARIKPYILIDKE